MTAFLTTLVGLALQAQAHLQPNPGGHRCSRSERGSVTTEHVLWAVAVIALVGIVVAAFRAFLTAQIGNIQ